MNSLKTLTAFNEADVANAKFRAFGLSRLLGDEVTEVVERTFEGSIGLSCRPNLDDYKQFNVVRLQSTSTRGLRELTRWYDDQAQRPLIAMTPPGVSTDVFHELATIGFQLCDTRSLLYGDLTERKFESDSDESTIQVATASSESEFKEAFDIYNSHSTLSWDAFSKKYLSTLKLFSNERLFLAYDLTSEGAGAVGMGILAQHGQSGLLSSGIVRPKSRGRGIQTALIRARIRSAQESGLDFIFAGGVPPFSASEANLRHCGLHLLCQRLMWRRTGHQSATSEGKTGAQI